MNYKQLSEIAQLPKDLSDAVVEFTNKTVSNLDNLNSWYTGYETSNKNSVAYVEPGKEFEETNGNQTGGVGHFTLPRDLKFQIIDFYKDNPNPFIEFDGFAVQICIGGKFVGPHIDDPIRRKEGYLYLLQAGGSNVRTIWYDIKPEYKHLEIENYKYIPYSKLNVVENHRLEENSWHYLKFSNIHSVENQEQLRIALWGY